ncbi:glycosyltransferase [Anaerobium acetethylicum]|uniref:Glycosyltransferase involved in cell wall bisynthesis n=1 Tax=Anaerobium acetethylicum TaxID=1619234 RepID=A0A1D3TRC3_9FIRM|nr:glycosyltransferase [Anaerobium acetethylicum]SCP96233.1 Glycosyltransferase involved in cell wall bisynthesis [Anaerobium acetethylicum]
MKNRNIAFVMHRFTGGGAERITITLANELSKRGYKITFLVKENNGDFNSSLSHDINVIELGTSKYIFFKNLASQLRNYTEVFLVSLGMSFFTLLAKFFSNAKCRLFIVIHNTTSSEKIDHKKAKFFILRHLDYLVEKTIVVSNEARLDYIDSIGVKDEKTVTIYNPVVSRELKEKMSVPLNLDEYKGLPIIVAAGRLTKQKNYELMLKTFKEVLKKKDAYLLILGQGELENALHNLSDQLNITDRVVFKGFEQNPYKYFYNADCFWMTSLWEGLPTVMIEAMACGCVPVSTNCKSGPKEILEDGKYGILTSFEEDEISESIIGFLSGRFRFEKDEIIERSEVFNLENAVSKYVDLMEDYSNENIKK